jgi:hypothetical protein
MHGTDIPAMNDFLRCYIYLLLFRLGVIFFLQLRLLYQEELRILMYLKKTLG